MILDELNQELNAEGRPLMDPSRRYPDMLTPSEKASKWVIDSLTQTQKMWEGVERGMNEYAKGLGE